MSNTTAEPLSVDEIGLIRHQHATEQAHLAAAAQRFSSLSSADLSKDNTIRYVNYFNYYMKQCANRCATIAAELLGHGTQALSKSERASLENIESLHGAILAALAQLNEPQGTKAALIAASDASLQKLRQMRETTGPAERHLTLAQWRRIAGLSADSVLEERRRFEELLA
jgi:hypothetical protein